MENQSASFPWDLLLWRKERLINYFSLLMSGITWNYLTFLWSIIACSWTGFTWYPPWSISWHVWLHEHSMSWSLLLSKGFTQGLSEAMARTLHKAPYWRCNYTELARFSQLMVPSSKGQEENSSTTWAVFFCLPALISLGWQIPEWKLFMWLTSGLCNWNPELPPGWFIR